MTDPNTPPTNPQLPPEQGDSAAAHQIDQWIIEHILAGQLSPAEAAERLEIPVGSVLRATREYARNNQPEQHPLALEEGTAERLADNWNKAREGIDAPQEALPPLEAAVQSFAPTRWLFGTDKRRIITMLCLCVIAGGGIFAISTIRKRAGDAEPIAAPPSIVPGIERSNNALDVARSFLSAKTWQERLQYVRQTESIAEQMSDWHETRNHSIFVTDSPEFSLVKGTYINDISFLVFDVSRDSRESYPVAIDLSGEQPRIDWGSHVHYQPMSWESFKSERPSAPVSFRVRAEPSDYFIEPFADENQFLSLRLTSPTGIVGLNGFVRTTSELGVLLANLLEFRSKEKVNLILDLGFPKNSATPAVQIFGVREGWVE